MTSKQSEYILLINHVGRIGCYQMIRMVVPITMFVAAKNVYCYSLEGNNNYDA